MILNNLAVGANADFGDWDSFVRASCTGTVYHTSGWLHALWQGMGQDIRVHYLTLDGSIRLGVVLRRGSRLGFAAGRKPWATAYNGIVGYEQVTEQMQVNFLRSIGTRYVAARLVQAPAKVDWPRSPWSWDIKERFTPVLNLSDLAQTWAQFDRRVRQRVRKASSLGVSVEESTDFGDFAVLYRKSYSRQRIEVSIGESELARTLNLAHSAGVLNLFLARSHKGEPMAGLVVGQDRHRAYFMLAGADPQFRSSDAMTLLWWRVMEILAPQCPEIDLVGLGTPGIERFKRSFSPELRPYSEAQFAGLLGVPLPVDAAKRVARAVRRVYGGARGRGTEG